MPEFRLKTDRGTVLVRALSKIEAEEFAKSDVYRIVKSWEKASFFEAIKHASTRTLIEESKQERPDGLDFDDDCLVFTDGTAIACRSVFDGPLSEVTPEITAGSPTWKIYV